MRICPAIWDKSPACMPKSPKIPNRPGIWGGCLWRQVGNSGLA